MKHLYLITISSILTLLVITQVKAQGLKPCDPQPTNKARFTALVTSTKAQLTIPVKARPEWEWRAKATPDNACEYMWAVAVRNDNTDYEFGFYLYKWADSKPQRGDFIRLVSEGQKSVWRVTGAGGEIVEGAQVDVLPCDDRIIITIEGQEDVGRIFSSRPAEVTLKIKVPKKKLISETISVVYKD